MKEIIETFGRMPDFDLVSGSVATNQFLSLGLSNFHAAVDYVWRLPYGRNSNRADYNLVLKERRGTCATKHAVLAEVAAEQKKPIFLALGIYELNPRNTAGVGAVLDRYNLESLPEAHCYLICDDARIDVTHFPKEESATKKTIANFLYEERIEPEQIGDYKLALHRTFFQNWMCEKKLSDKFEFEELWTIREQCIAALAEN